ncbi:hypothetical protein [Streptomyces sp. NPDC006925]|uniref:hypothetical protein n=1 Tax=Streptomyces sp. NPDC006925 TaxID=3364768 RepID=UPI00368038C7
MENTKIRYLNDKRISALAQEWDSVNSDWANKPEHEGEGWDGEYGCREKFYSAADHGKLDHKARVGD